MADRGEQRLRKRMYKPKQFQKKKRIPPPMETTSSGGADNNIATTHEDGHIEDDAHDEDSTSSEDSEPQAKQSSDQPSSVSVERLLQLSRTDRAPTYMDNTGHDLAHREDDKATDLDQFLLDVDQPRSSLDTTPVEHDTDLSAWLDSIAIKK